MTNFCFFVFLFENKTLLISKCTSTFFIAPLRDVECGSKGVVVVERDDVCHSVDPLLVTTLGGQNRSKVVERSLVVDSGSLGI